MTWKGMFLPISSWPPGKVEGHPWVNCNPKLQVAIVISEDDPESYMARKKCSAVKWKIKSAKSSKNPAPRWEVGAPSKLPSYYIISDVGIIRCYLI